MNQNICTTTNDSNTVFFSLASENIKKLQVIKKKAQKNNLDKEYLDFMGHTLT